jgi:hypothetical protein
MRDEVCRAELAVAVGLMERSRVLACSRSIRQSDPPSVSGFKGHSHSQLTDVKLCLAVSEYGGARPGLDSRVLCHPSE